MAVILNIGNTAPVNVPERTKSILAEEINEYLPRDTVILRRIKKNLCDALYCSGCSCLRDMTLTSIRDVKNYLESIGYLGGAYSQYLHYIDKIAIGILRKDGSKMLKEIEGLHELEWRYSRAVSFLYLSGIDDIADVDYKLRERYRDFLENECELYKSHVPGLINAFDKIKINHSRIMMQKSFIRQEFKYKNEKIFLLYHPNADIAESFRYIRDKNEILFDFSLETSPLLKEQIFGMLDHILQVRPYGTINEKNDMRGRFITPLNHLYSFCVRNNIDDIRKMTEEDDRKFIEEEGRFGVTIANRNMQILGNIKKFLFIKNEEIDWEANIWYLEKLKMDETRNNPAIPVVSLKFDQIKNSENRNVTKQYAKYLLGITDTAVTKVRSMLYDISRLMEYCDEFDLLVINLTETDIDAFFQIIDYGIKIESYNTKVISIYKFYEYLQSKGIVDKIPFRAEYYLKKTHPYHRDRIVGDEVIRDMLEHIGEFPEHLRLMYFNLLCTGLRINEICALKGNAYFERNGDTWMRVYQNKMASEKVIPIPAALFELMCEYIKRQDIKSDEYIFKNKSGGAYNTTTFRKQMIVCCTKYGIHCDNYIFRPHDYRHTIASSLFDSGASLQAVREYLGHKTEEMTKQYIDYVPDMIDEKNEEYFGDAGNIITADVTRKMKLKIRIRELPGYDPAADVRRKNKVGNRCFDLSKLKSKKLQDEFRDFIFYRSTRLTMKSLSEDVTNFSLVSRFLNSTDINSILDKEWKYYDSEFRKWLFGNGYSVINKRKRNDTGNTEVYRHAAIGYLEAFCVYMQPESEKCEFEKDKWELDKLGIVLKENAARPVCTMDFSGIPQDMIKEETKRIAFMELGYKAVASVVPDVAAIRRLAVYLDSRYPQIKSLTDLNRDIAEDYLIYLNTEADRGRYQPKDVALLKELMNLAGRMLGCDKLKALFLNSDVKKKRKTVYKAYSDAELARLNAAIADLDKQLARALTILQLLGLRISDLLILKQDCIKEYDGKYVITIYQQKTGKSFTKPISEDIKLLIDAAVRYTNETYGASEYVFVNDKCPSKPMNVATVSYHLRKMIYQNDLRDDNGKLFEARTHIFRHNYGKRLADMDIPDETIAKLLGHSGISTVHNYRRMGNEKLAQETKEVRSVLDKMIRNAGKKGE